MIRNLVTDKARIWDEDKENIVLYLGDISAYFRGELNWDRGAPDESYASWFAEIAESVQGLDYKKSSRAGSKIQNIVKALE